jgi:lipopolysaccharide/colanic/teichoic acid biosynthesis glycosyltransferase
MYQRTKPGISGLWQVSGRNDTTYTERVKLDAYYVQNWSVWLDIVILARTVRSVILRQGAY